MNKKSLGDLGEEFVAERLRNAGFDVEHLGGTTPYLDIIAQRDGTGMVKIQVKTWATAKNDSRIASVNTLQRADVYIFVRADDLECLRAYVYQTHEIAAAVKNADTPTGFPFTRDPGVKNSENVGYWARKGWLFCDAQRFENWELLKRSGEQTMKGSNQ